LTELAYNLDSNLLEKKLPNRSEALLERLDACNVLSLKTLGALLDFKFHCLTFVERLISFHRDRREVHENIFSGLALDESEAL